MSDPPSVPRRRGGFTLAELSVTFGLLAIALAASMPALSSAADRWAVAGARDELVALVQRTRIEARLHGGATLRILPDSVAELRIADSTAGRWSGADRGVRIDPGTGDEVRLEWDALGTGRVASRTVVLLRGGAEARIVLSSTGRVRLR